MADEFLYTSTTDIRAVPLIEALTIEYDTRYGTYFNEEGAAAEMNKYPPEAFALPHGNSCCCCVMARQSVAVHSCAMTM